MTTATTTAGQSGQVDITQLLSDLESTTTAVQNNDWVTAGLDGATSALDLLGSGSDPLSGIANAGFGFLTELVSFLAAPLKTLAGDPSSVSSSSQGLHGAGQNLSSMAGSYQQSSSSQTSSWSGAAASGYQNTSKQLADELRAIGKASAGVASAMSGASEVIGKATAIITQYVNEATAEINTIMAQAMATAQVTGGASVAAAIPQCVQVAARYGGQIAEKMGVLLSSSQNLAKLVMALLKSLEAVNTAIKQTTANSSKASSQPTSTSAAKTKNPAQQNVIGGPGTATAGTADQ